MSDDISVAVRLLVTERAARRCEYCLLHEDDSFTPHQVDHIISRKHGGDSSPANLALACVRCNAWKGSNIASFGGDPQRIVPLYHPRTDRWSSRMIRKIAVMGVDQNIYVRNDHRPPRLAARLAFRANSPASSSPAS